MMTDLVGIHRARVNLRQAYAAIEQTSWQAKPAILGSLDQADDVMLELLRKSATRAVRFAMQGAYRRVHVPPELAQLLVDLAPEEAQRWRDFKPKPGGHKLITRAATPQELNRKLMEEAKAQAAVQAASSNWEVK
jgi:hypothetical protein